MIEKYLIKNRWAKINKYWFDTTGRISSLCHRWIAVRIQLSRDKNFCYRIMTKKKIKKYGTKVVLKYRGNIMKISDSTKQLLERHREEIIKLMNNHDLLQHRIENLENSPFGKSPTYAPLLKRLEDIEKIQQNYHEYKIIIDATLEKLKEMQSAMLNSPNLIWQKYNKTPHKCPVCDGEGNLQTEFKSTLTMALDTRYKMDAKGITYISCHSCDGRGILWN